uniref:Uncharacterized protein n=1 Tax=Arundo donax TaxID=35708 RepID=A0A0A9GS08_ARUDO
MRCAPSALAFLSPRSIPSYSATLLVVLNFNEAEYCNFWLLGKQITVEHPAPEVHQAPSVLINQVGSSSLKPLVCGGDVHSARKSARIPDFTALRATNSTSNGAISAAHFAILPVDSLFPKMSRSGYAVGTDILCDSK